MLRRFRMCSASDIIPAPVRNIKIATAYFAVSLAGLIDKRKSLVLQRKSLQCCFFYILFSLDFDEDANMLSLPRKNDTPRMRQENNRVRFGKRGSRIGPCSTFSSPLFFLSPASFFPKTVNYNGNQKTQIQCQNRKNSRKPGRVGSHVNTKHGVSSLSRWD